LINSHLAPLLGGCFAFGAYNGAYKKEIDSWL
jgi:hypothetical protein